MEKNYLQNGSNSENYHHIPDWAKALIELYKSPLKYEVMYEMEYESIR